uniref:Putative swap mrna splicing regulator n=1 Tax=Panstrongylus lignarius TaxID=156445 RepID=A0A224XL85_9HEMI
MWHEVRKQEKKIRCMIVDYRKRAERRKDYYEKIKADPTQFLQVHGRQCKVHLDPAIAAAGDSPANMMSWRGSQDVIIDRFDVRAHLDFIQEYKSEEETKLTYEDRNINYERYRILVQNDFLGVGEEKFLQQLYMEEQFGAVNVESNQSKKKASAGAAIGLNYDDPTAPVPQLPAAETADENADGNDGHGEDDDSDIDFDVCVDVNKVTTQQAHELNKCAHPYGMDGNDFFSFLTKDREEADNLRLAKELEEEKAMYSGRKSRRERRAYRERKLAGRIISPPSYASRKSPTYRDYGDSDSRSRSASPLNSGKITYITSFSVEEPAAPTSPKPVKTNSKSDHSRSTKHRSRSPEGKRNRSRSRSGSNSRKYSRTRKSRSRSKSSSRTRSKRSSSRRYRSRSTSRSRRIQSKHSSRRSASRPLSWSRSSSRSSSRNHQRLESKSRSPQRNTKTVMNNPHAEALVKQPPAPIISRYYGRRGRSSSSELSLSDDDKPSTDSNSKLNDKKTGTVIGNTSSRNKPGQSSGISKMTPQERLKRKMQALLNKQYKADKKAEREKREKVEQERIDREDEMREMSIKLRKRERMRRHEYLAEYERLRSDSSRSRSRSPSWSRSPSPKRHERRHRSRSRRRSRSRSRSVSREKKNRPLPRPLVDY